MFICDYFWFFLLLILFRDWDTPTALRKQREDDRPSSELDTAAVADEDKELIDSLGNGK